MKDVLARGRRAQRVLTAGLRDLPDFLIIGAQKGGTTSLYNYVASHPDVRPALTKEVHYFDREYHRGLSWYRSNFSPSWLRPGRTVTGEATPYYLFHPLAPGRVHAALPDVKLLVVLRNPVDRAYSHYQHERAKGREALGFAEAVAEEQRRLSQECAQLLAGVYSYNHQRFSYLARGLYADQLEHWGEQFPPDRFLLLQSEEMYADPAATLRRVAEFLDLEPFPANRSYRQLNARSYSTLDPALRAELRAYFKPHNERLYALAGLRFDWDD